MWLVRCGRVNKGFTLSPQNAKRDVSYPCVCTVWLIHSWKETSCGNISKSWILLIHCLLVFYSLHDPHQANLNCNVGMQNIPLNDEWARASQVYWSFKKNAKRMKYEHLKELVSLFTPKHPTTDHPPPPLCPLIILVKQDQGPLGTVLWT